MKRIIGLMLLVAVLVLMTAPGVSAVSTGYVNRIGGYYSGNGGEFTMVPSTDWSWVLTSYVAGPDGTLYTYPTGQGTGFQTFCMETNESVGIPSTNFIQISNFAKAGGAGGGKPDPISVGTAWLYHNFQEKTLQGYNYTVGVNRAASAAELQNTIWWLEGETGNPGNVFSAAVVTKFGSSVNAMADNNGTYAVGVLNLWQNPDFSGYRQDMLVCLVPEPTTLLLLGAGLIGLVTLRRRFTR